MLEQRHAHVMEKLVVWLVLLTISPVAEEELLGCSLLPHYSLDQTARDLLAAGHPRRPRQKQVRVDPGKCPMTPTTRHSQATVETARMHENGSCAPRPPGQVGSNLAGGLSCSFNQTRGSRGPRELFRFSWKRRSQAPTPPPKVAAGTIALMRRWPEKIGSGELKRSWSSVETRHSSVIAPSRSALDGFGLPPARRTGWATFCALTQTQIWACDLLQVTGSFFDRSRAFFLIELRVSQGDARRRDPISDRCLGGAYRCEKRLPMDNHRNI